jgi:general secretion pathway protein B
MSYILEALKKSQQERDLGQVPTLDANLFPTVAQAIRPSPWGLAAVGLAALAVVIALYAALRSQPLTPSAEPSSPESPVAQRAQNAQKSDAPKVAEPITAPGSADAPQQNARPEPSPVTGAPPAAPESGTAVAPAPIEASAPPPVQNKVVPLIPPPLTSSPVPDDVRADIEAFKEQVRLEREGKSAKPEKPAAQPKTAGKPEDLRLPPDIEGRLPAFFMTVHVYDKDPAKRFVGINSLKTREGEHTREGITVEEILPDGAVLSFEGHKFFRHR